MKMIVTIRERSQSEFENLMHGRWGNNGFQLVSCGFSGEEWWAIFARDIPDTPVEKEEEIEQKLEATCMRCRFHSTFDLINDPCETCVTPDQNRENWISSNYQPK